MSDLLRVGTRGDLEQQQQGFGDGLLPDASPEVEVAYARSMPGRTAQMRGGVYGIESAAALLEVSMSESNRVALASQRVASSQHDAAGELESDATTGSTHPMTPTRTLTDGSGDAWKLRESLCPGSVDNPLKKCWARMSFRGKRYLAFMLTEVVLVALLVVQFWVLSDSLDNVMQTRSESAVNLVRFTYELKMNEMALGFQGYASNADVVSCLTNTSEANCQPLRATFTRELEARQIEFAALLDANATVLANPGINNDRAGDTLDPKGIVSYLYSLPRGELPTHIMASVVMPYPHFLREGAPLWRERVSELDSIAPTHPYDTQLAPLVRFVVVPVVHENETIGAVLAGDVVNGKAPIASRVVNVLHGGLALVQYRGTVDPDFRIATSYLGVDLDGDMLATFTPVPRHVVPASLPEEAARSLVADSVHSRVSTVLGISYHLTATAFPALLQNDDPVPQLVGATDVVLILGLSRESINTLLLNVLLLLIACGLASIGFDSLAFLVGLHYFIAPLEHLTVLVKTKHSVALRKLAELPSQAWYLVLLLLSFLVALAALIVFAVAANALLVSTLEQQPKDEVRLGAIAYRLELDQMALGFRGLSSNPVFLQLAADPDDVDVLAEAEQVLSLEISRGRIEIAGAVSGNGSVLALGTPMGKTANYSALPHFDPDGAVTRAAAEKVQFKQTRLISRALLLAFQPVLFAQDESQQQLHPLYRDVDSALVRYTFTPVFDAEGDDVVLVLVSDSIVDGKPAIPQTINAVFESGYSAVLVYEPDGEGVRLLTSSPPVTAGCTSLAVATAMGTATSGEAVRRCSVGGSSYLVAAELVPDDTLVADFGEREEERNTSAPFKAVILRGTPTGRLDSILDEQLALTILVFVIECVSGILLTVLLFYPMRRFIVQLHQRGLHQQAKVERQRVVKRERAREQRARRMQRERAWREAANDLRQRGLVSRLGSRTPRARRRPLSDDENSGTRDPLGWPREQQRPDHGDDALPGALNG